MKMITFTKDEIIINQKNFDYLIKIDDDFNYLVYNFTKKYYRNIARCMISSFNLNILNKFNTFLKNIEGDSIDSSLGKNKLINLCNDLDENIIINNVKDLENLKVIFNIAMLLIDEGISNNDMDCFYEAFYGLEYDLREKSLIKNNIKKNYSNIKNPNIKIIPLNMVQNGEKQIYSISNNIL